MKKHLFAANFLLVILLNITTAFGQTGHINAKESKVTFSISHTTGKVTGTFTGMQGSVQFNEQNPEAGSMDATIEASTIDTKKRARDKDLRNKKFFNTEKYPKIHFRSTHISKTENGYQVKGNLTIKDVTKEVIIPFRQEMRGNQQVFTGSFTVNRKEFKLGLKTFPPMGKIASVTIVAVVE